MAPNDHSTAGIQGLVPLPPQVSLGLPDTVKSPDFHSEAHFWFSHGAIGEPLLVTPLKGEWLCKRFEWWGGTHTLGTAALGTFISSIYIQSYCLRIIATLGCLKSVID